MTALLAWVRQAPRRLMDLVRPESLEGLFGDAYKKLATDDERALQALDLIDKILPIWMSGAPLCDIEAVARGGPQIWAIALPPGTSPHGWLQTSLSSRVCRPDSCLHA